MTKKKRYPPTDITEEAGAPAEATDATTVAEEAASEQLAMLQADLETAQRKSTEYLEAWQRERADFTNYKRRIERDQAQTYQNAAGSVIKRYLDVLDDLERALKNRPAEGEGAAWANGIELVYRKLLAHLDAEGVKPMESQGQQFDPNQHEAIVMEDSPQHSSGQIIEVLQNGYQLGDRVLRPARVRVAR
jgi:molecular chaperone GrpE